MRKVLPGVAAMMMASAATPALAQDSWGGPIAIGDGVTLDPIIDARLRFETVDQDTAADNAEALTLRLRAGAELKSGSFSFLAEGEGTLALADDYNDTIPSNGVEPYPVVADPDNIELNRLQIGFAQDGYSLIVGRQRIILGNSRFVGNVGWRQNEQTFDAVRGTAAIGPVSLDATYSISQRTIFGNDSPNEDFDGDLFLFNAGVKAGPVTFTGFAYLIDYDDRITFSSNTFGLIASGTIPVGEKAKLSLMGSYATQRDAGDNPTDYKADYFNVEAGLGVAGFSVTAGYELLGSDDGIVAFQTPLATLHKFNGWADLFLTTPTTGLEDIYAGAAYKFPKGMLLPGLKANVTYHDFNSDVGGFDYGSEWDASLGFKLGPVGILAKYANYDAAAFGTDTEKFWLQAEYSF